MEIDIQIRGVTPEEAQTVLKGISQEGKTLSPRKKAAAKSQKSHGGKYQIPFSSITQKKEYQNARNLCVKYRSPYPEALRKQQEEETGAPAPQPVQAPAPAITTIDMISPNDLITGWKVRQIKPDGCRENMFGVGVVTARKAGLIEVRDGSGKKHTIDARCLVVDTTGQQASDRATGVSS